MLHAHVWKTKRGQAAKCSGCDQHAIMVKTWLVHWPSATASIDVLQLQFGYNDLLTCSRKQVKHNSTAS